MSQIYYIQVHFRLDFIMETNTINPDQTAALGVLSKQSDNNIVALPHPPPSPDLTPCEIGLNPCIKNYIVR